MRFRGWAIAVLIVVGCLVAAGSAGAEIREFSTGFTAGAEPNGIALGPDGAMWFTEQGTAKLGRIAPDGTVGEYPPSAATQLHAGAAVSGVVAGPDGNLWFTEYGTGLVGDISPTTGLLLGEYTVGPSTSEPQGITVGPDGNIWVALNGDRAVARIVPRQVSPGTADGVTVLPLSSSNTAYSPVDLVTGPDHDLWVSDSLGGVWQVNPANPVPAANHFFQITGNSPDPEGIASAGGRVWVALFGAGEVAEINPATVTSPVTTVFSTGGSPLWIAGAGDGDLWLTDHTNSELRRFDPATDTATAFGTTAGVTGDANTDAADGSGNLWFTEYHSDRIGEVVFVLVNTTPPMLSGDAKPGSTLACSNGQWSPQADAFSYQWLRDGAAISGATAASYTLPADAAGHAFACRVIATETATFTSGTATSAAVTATAAGAAPKPAPAPVAPPATLRNLTPPAITGTAKENGQLTCDPGTWTVAGTTFRYDWYYTGASSSRVTRFNTKLKSVGIKPSKLNGLLKTRLAEIKFTPLANTQKINVGPLKAPTSFYCAVIASAPKQLPVSASSRTIAINPNPPALARSRASLKTSPPHINPHVGVPGTNTCQPGLWTGGPKFTYAWYSVKRDRKVVTGYRFTSLGSGPTYEVKPADETQTIECWVTAKNRYGSDTERSNSYRVPVGAPKQTGDTEVAATALSPDSAGTFGVDGGSVTAEQVTLRCLANHWNRSDLHFGYEWTLADGDYWALQVPEYGQTLTFDMRPGHLQYLYMAVQCNVTATTSHGVSSTAQSGLVDVSNGCEEDYTLSNLNYYSVNFFQNFYNSFQWLEGEAGSHGDTAGLFGYYGNGIPTGGQPRRAITIGPNCEDYQKYLQGQGFDVKQDPSDVGFLNG